MITIRNSEDRGHFDLGWLDTYHTFSFADYYDPHFMNFRGLRVINEDRVRPGRGFPTHGHSDMEIITYVLEGALEHKDSMGTGSVIRPGDVQKMSAGTGVRHSEFNQSKEEAVHLLQIWILPDTKGIKPDYQQKRFAEEEKRGNLRLIVSPDGSQGSITIQQDAFVYAALLSPSQSVAHKLEVNRHAWVQVAGGAVELNSIALGQGDGAAVSEESSITITGVDEAEILLFDLA